MSPGTRQTRRTFLGTVGAGTLMMASGCTGGGDPATVQWSLKEVGEEHDPLTDEDEHEIDHESYFTDGFEIVETTEIEYTVEVLEGPNVNVFILDEENEDAFEDGDEFEAVEESISLDVSFTENPGVELEPGNYALIIYNGDDEPENA